MTVDPHPAAASASAARMPATAAVVLPLHELAARLPALRPPPAYRLSLDSGVGYKNVRRAFEEPMAIRIGTWQRLLRSLHIQLVVVSAAADRGAPTIIESGPGTLRARRLARRWSRRDLAERAGVGIDAVAAIEAGVGLAGSLARVCAALDLRLGAALPPHCRSLEQLWEERAAGCLAAPAQFPPARPRRTGSARGRSELSPCQRGPGIGREGAVRQGKGVPQAAGARERG